MLVDFLIDCGIVEKGCTNCRPTLSLCFRQRTQAFETRLFRGRFFLSLLDELPPGSTETNCHVCCVLMVGDKTVALGGVPASVPVEDPPEDMTWKRGEFNETNEQWRGCHLKTARPFWTSGGRCTRLAMLNLAFESRVQMMLGCLAVVKSKRNKKDDERMRCSC